ncbi:hypothetical protein GIX83_02330 [Lactobacillus reuteri]|uniref:Uncharacterized protein n=1 Tax=Limosilactobacillus reuteri TaxID=1598 RepID=A0A6A8D4F4_LIMRT|nr:hypothetical protein [Limosilactobacillus reuteri]MRG68660.1 hypothetical protein [Limosilactobacillus reuteri]MRG68710.1 hypothetical protein [Limosilactobacillus reuteri]
MMMKISATLVVPIMFIAIFLVKPSLIGMGMFIKTLVVELLVISMVSDYNANS